METILVTAIGSFSADIVIKSLKRMNYRVVGCDIYPKEWIADAYQVNSFYQAPYATNKEEYLKFIQKVCENENITMIMPLTDVEVDVFNNNRDWFKSKGIIVCISSKETIDICRDKKCIEEYIVKHNININTIQTQYLQYVDTTPSNFPLVLKPYNGRSSQGLKYINSVLEWKHVINEIDKNEYIVQPFIPGSVVTVDVIRKDNDNVVVVSRKELLRTLNGAGTSVYVFNDAKLAEMCKELANSLNIIGCVNFEFIVTEDQSYYFIECNPRFSGGVEFSCMTGYDFVMNHVKCFKNEIIEKQHIIRNQYVARKYEEYITYIEN